MAAGEAGQLPADDEYSIHITGVETVDPPEGETGTGIVLRTTRGDIRCLYHQAPDPSAAVVWVWGILGGFAGPAQGIYGRLAERLKGEGVSSVRVSYRQARDLPESVLDTLAGVSFLKGLGYQRMALVGHSFGGAVVITAAPLSPEVVAVVGLSSQTLGATGVAQVSPRPLLLVHGMADRNLSHRCSELIYEWAQEPKELVLYPGAGHGLRQCQEELDALLSRWLVEKLRDAAS